MVQRIDNSLELRLKGWRRALKSPRTPKWLKPSIAANIRRVEQKLRARRRRLPTRKAPEPHFKDEDLGSLRREQ